MSRTKTVLGSLLAISLGGFGAVAVAGGQDTDKPMHEQHQQQTPQQGSTKQPTQETHKQTRATPQKGEQMAAKAPINAIALNALEESEVSSLQQKLKDLGFYRGEVDGKVGPLTRGALQRFFQRQAQLAGRGLVEQEAIAAFDIDVSDRVPVRGMEQQQGQPGEQQTPQQPPQKMPQKTPQQTPQQAPEKTPSQPPETEY